MAYHQNTAGKREQRLLEQAQGRQIEVVRRLVENEKVASVLENAGEQ